MDHLIFVAPDLAEAVRLVEERLGVAAAPGGRHVGFGTRNRLVGLGPATYLEIVGIDPDQPEPEGGRWFGVVEGSEPRLLTWCARPPDLVQALERGRAAGIDLGAATAGSRLRDDGTRLSWTMTDPFSDRAGGVVPFLIDWGDSPHPASALTSVCEVLALRLVHPDPASVTAWLGALGVAAGGSLDIAVAEGDAPGLIATLDTPLGVVDLS